MDNPVIIASMGGPNVAVYSAIYSPVIIASMGGSILAVYSAMDSPVIIARKVMQLL